jgi:hypothetical protein
VWFPRRTARCAALGAALVTAWILLVPLLRPGVGDALDLIAGARLPEAGLDRLCRDLACCFTAVAGAALSCSAVVTVASAALATVRGRQVGGRGPVRRLVLGVCGFAVVTGSVTSPAALAHDRDRPAVCAAPCLTGLRLPDLPVSTGHPPARRLVVRPGDSLWSITEGLLPQRATDADVARAVALLHRANRRTLGSDPDLIFPGDRIVAPEGLR